MWIARASLARRAVLKLWSFSNESQVLTKTLSPRPCHSHLHSTTAFPAIPLIQNPRCLSHTSPDHSELEPDEDSCLDAQKVESLSRTGGLGLGLDEIKVNSDASTDIFGLLEQTVGDSGEQWSAIDVEKLEEVLYLLHSSVDGSETLESSLSALNLSLSEKFVFRVLETPLIPGGYMIRFFRWAMEKKDLHITTPLLDTLVLGVCQNVQRNGAYALWDLIKEIGEKKSKLLNAELLNDMISSFLRLGKGMAAFEVFNKFEEFGCVPNFDTYYFTIEALCRRSIYSLAILVAKKMFDAGFLPDSEKIGEIICMFCKGNRTIEAHLVYHLAKESNTYPPQHVVNLLISDLAYVNETVDLALQVLNDISPEARRNAMNQYSRVVQGLCRTKRIDRAKKLLLEMVKAGLQPGKPVFNIVINCLSKTGNMDDAVETLRLVQRRGMKPDVYTYSVIMSGYARKGQMDEACKILEEAKKEHSKLCNATFHSLIRGFCKVRDYDKALKLLSETTSYGVEPNVDVYDKLVQTLCLDALDWRRAEKLMEEMKEKGLYLPGKTKGLINEVKRLELEPEVFANFEANVEASVSLVTATNHCAKTADESTGLPQYAV